MARTLNSDGTYTVKSGDTLTEICQELLGDGSMTKAYEIGRINNIPDINRLWVGQVIKLSATTATTTSGTEMKAPVITDMGIQLGTDREVYVAWEWDKTKLATTEKYEYEWYYDTGNSLEWFYGGGGDSETRTHATFTAPKNAKRVRFLVRPIATSKEG